VNYDDIIVKALQGTPGELPKDLDEAYRGRALFFALYVEGLRAYSVARARGARVGFFEWSIGDAFSLKVNEHEVKFERVPMKPVIKVVRFGLAGPDEEVMAPVGGDYRVLAGTMIGAALDLLLRESR
jgi:hypothetical protein